MSQSSDFAEQELVAQSVARAGDRLSRRERRTEAGLSLGFVAAAGALWVVDPPHTVSPVPALLCLLVLVVARRVRIDTPYGFTAPTQLAVVPLLFATPVTAVPAGVVAALVAARLPDVFRGRLEPGRLRLEVVNAWFVLGPVAVFASAHRPPAQAGAGLLIAALAAQFAVDVAISTLRLRLEHGATISAQLDDAGVYGIDAALSVIALVVAEDVQRHPLVALTPLPLLALLASFARERHRRVESLIELNAAYQNTALVLGDVIEADDGYTGEHCRSVVALAMDLATALGLNGERRRRLEFGALLHDVGKIAIPKEIINKPGKLDPEEWALMTTHTVEGQRMLDRIGGFMRDVGLIVRSHHERWDGGGYPDGLRGEAIPLEARIITCCDSWNAMRTDRSYRRALPHDVALAEMRANAGTQFDPTIVETFLARVAVEQDEERTPPVPLRSMTAVTAPTS